MKPAFFVLILTIFNFALYAEPLTLASQPTLPKAGYVLPQAVKEWQKEGQEFTLIDVREKEEYEAGHIDGAVNIPFSDLENRIGELDKDERYVTYCIYSSWRAPYSANLLLDLGLKNVSILEGGISAWNAGGQVIYASRPGQEPKITSYSPDLWKNLKHPADSAYPEPVDLTLAELSRYNGKNGQPAYVAVNGIIYDVTQSRLWRGGEHDPSKGKAAAGADLTEVIQDSPHGTKILENFPVVGKVIKKKN